MDNKKRNIVLTLIVLLAIGFASVSSVLVINGLLAIGENSEDFKIIFTSASIDGTKRNDVISEGKTEISYGTKVLSLIDEQSVLEYEATNTSRNYDADVQIVCNIVDEDSNIIEGENEYVDMTYTPKSMSLLAGETKQGSITAKLKKAVTEPMDINIKCTLTGTAKERDELGDEITTTTTTTSATTIEPTKECTISDSTVYIFNQWTLKDNDCNGDISNGDLITVGSESFYVYNIDGDNVKAIAQYNLYVGNICSNSSACTNQLADATGLQDPRAIGFTASSPYIATVPYITWSYYNEQISKPINSGKNISDYSISQVKPYVEAYAAKLNELDATITVNNVRLITKEELEVAGCDSSQTTCSEAPFYITSTSYWTSSQKIESTKYGYTYYVWAIYSRGDYVLSCEFDYRNNLDGNFAGVRPVIEVSKSLFE